MTQPQENRLKISSPQRITRIIKRICDASLQIMIKGSKLSATAVKGRASTIIPFQNCNALRISNISQQGMVFLEGRNRVQVEFVMMATKVVFISEILKRDENCIYVLMPKVLVSIERRKNARYSTTEDLTSFLKLSLWESHVSDVTAPPFFPHFNKDIGHYITIADVSMGGFCGVTKFPSLATVLRRGLIDDNAKILMPMQSSLNVGVEIRWIKKIREHIVDADGHEGFVRSYRFGFEFTNPNEETENHVRTLLQQLSQADAI